MTATGRCCPRCRLPRPPAAAHHVALHGGQSAIVGLCLQCEQALDRLPARTRHKAIERAVDRAAGDPGRHWCAVFADRNAADLSCALLGVRRHADDALAALGWR